MLWAVAACSEGRRSVVIQGQASDDLVELSARVEREDAGGTLTITVKNKSSADLHIDRRLIYMLGVAFFDKDDLFVGASRSAEAQLLPPIEKPDFGALKPQAAVSRTITFGREETLAAVNQGWDSDGMLVEVSAEANLYRMPTIDQVATIYIAFGNVNHQVAALRGQLDVEKAGKLYDKEVQVVLKLRK
jgi:hypothetical protein